MILTVHVHTGENSILLIHLTSVCSRVLLSTSILGVADCGECKRLSVLWIFVILLKNTVAFNELLLVFIKLH